MQTPEQSHRLVVTVLHLALMVLRLQWHTIHRHLLLPTLGLVLALEQSMLTLQHFRLALALVLLSVLTVLLLHYRRVHRHTLMPTLGLALVMAPSTQTLQRYQRGLETA
jgi:hypothetical protein